MVHCLRFAVERRNMNQALRWNVTPESVVAQILSSKENWVKVYFAILKMRNDEGSKENENSKDE